MDKIKMLKDKILSFMDQEVDKYGSSRMDVKEIGELADVVKDLAEAEYYCSISKSMEQGSYDQSGYNPNPMMGYGGGGMGGSGGGRSGYGGSGMGHTDSMATVREMMADPELRRMIRNEVMK